MEMNKIFKSIGKGALIGICMVYGLLVLWSIIGLVEIFIKGLM